MTIPANSSTLRKLRSWEPFRMEHFAPRSEPLHPKGVGVHVDQQPRLVQNAATSRDCESIVCWRFQLRKLHCKSNIHELVHLHICPRALPYAPTIDGLHALQLQVAVAAVPYSINTDP